jgi:catalase
MSTNKRAHHSSPIGAAPLGVASEKATAATIADDARATPLELVDALYKAFGRHQVRAVHAKGVILEGSFKPTPQAHMLSKASLFAGGSVPTIVRFSNFTGIPDIPDTADAANPRGLAIKFRLANGADTDIVAHSYNGFPTATAEEFHQLLLALGASGPTSAKPSALERFLSEHPIAKTFLTTQKRPPVSYATLIYFGVNSFKFINAAGNATFVRSRFVPISGEQLLDVADCTSKGANYLSDEIAKRVAAQPVDYDWFAQFAGPSDIIDNPSITWPETRALVKLGTISVERMAASQASASNTTLFLPGNLPSGIEAADPMIKVRDAAYLISFDNRQ